MFAGRKAEDLKQMKPLYPIPAVLRFFGCLPNSTQIRGRHVVGSLGPVIAGLGRWKEPPHQVFANLPRFDLVATGTVAILDNPRGPELRRDAAGNMLPELVELKAMEAFARKHGVLCGQVDETTRRFDEDAATFTDAQDSLRKAWAGDGEAVNEVEAQAQVALKARPSVRARSVELIMDDLWSLICLLFLMDHAAGKTGVCGNPECPAPYFLRKRKDQKYCERGKCSAYAQRRYALGWWERKGYELRAKKSKGSKRRKLKWHSFDVASGGGRTSLCMGCATVSRSATKMASVRRIGARHFPARRN
jgi:hypothetical protein